jgi:hypothetical protein
MPVKLNSSGGGSVTLTTPSTASDFTVTFPANTGNVVTDSATQTLTNKTLNGAVMTAMASSVITSGTAQASTSGTSIDFTGIPSWVKRITLMFNGVSTNGTSTVQVQLGTGAGPTFTTTGYLGSSMAVGSGTATIGEQNGTGLRLLANNAATMVNHGNIIIANVTGNTWALSSVLGQSDAVRVSWAGGSIALAATLTAVRITTVAGTDTFDAGSINILYE